MRRGEMMFGGPSFKLFSLFGFRVGAHWSFPVALVLAGIGRGGLEGVVLALLLFVSVLLHELGHAFVARRREVPIAGIDLHFFGGVAKMSAPPRSPNDEVAIAIAGPLVSLALGVIGLALAQLTGLSLLWWLGAANLVLALFNMVPALPLDGGRVLRALLAKRSGLYQGTRRAVQVNRVFSVALAAFALWSASPWLVMMAVLVWMMGTAELRQAEQHALLTEIQDWYPVRSPWARYDEAARQPRRVPVPSMRPLEPDAVILPYRW